MSNSHILPTPVDNQKSSIKSFLSRYFSKKSSSIVESCRKPIRRSRKKSDFIGEINPSKKSHSLHKKTHNYDMTILHEDELNNTQLATIRRRKKTIPNWAKQDQLQLAIINQVYFQEQNPEEIFGSFRLDEAFDMINSLLVSRRIL
ncbi:unnamed protein product [Adineta ricciae]|uniref:Inner centromere protein ARK-binding domain-containing protein n=1 Tax=Adineta ricciae TaxID=249248 RepID=A0A814Y151_ADIRI|nr:unnamed protein product [Adineta ricciae]CAF1273734.1 unnamed protein product [Adineta ricciae]